MYENIEKYSNTENILPKWESNKNNLNEITTSKFIKIYLLNF